MATPPWVSHLMIVIRPIVAIFLVVTLILLGWVMAWKLVLVHVPFVQEVCGLRKKPPEPKPATRRFSHLYNNSSNRPQTNPSSRQMSESLQKQS